MVREKYIIVVNTCLSPYSKTAMLAKETLGILKKQKNVKTEFIDLRKIPLEFCDGRNFNEYGKNVKNLYKKLEKADGYIIGYPVYNYSISGPCKNFIDLFSHAMSKKHFGIVHHSNGVRSWGFGIEDMMKSLAIHNNVTFVGPPIHTFKDDYDDENKLISNEIRLENMKIMVSELVKKC